jgi:hypothetical protein
VKKGAEENIDKFRVGVGDGSGTWRPGSSVLRVTDVVTGHYCVCI